MKKILLVPFLVALVAGAWTPMAQAQDVTKGLGQAADVVRIIQSVKPVIDPVFNNLGPAGKTINQVLTLGLTSVTTADTLNKTAQNFPATTRKAISDLQTAALMVNTASNKVKDAKTAQEQIDALMSYLDAQGKFIAVIADYMANLNSDIFNPVFSFIQAMPYVGDKVVINGKPVNEVVGGMLLALKKRNDTFMTAVKVLPTVIKSVEATAATGGTVPAAAAPVVKAEDFGF